MAGSHVYELVMRKWIVRAGMYAWHACLCASSRYVAACTWRMHDFHASNGVNQDSVCPACMAALCTWGLARHQWCNAGVATGCVCMPAMQHAQRAFVRRWGAAMSSGLPRKLPAAPHLLRRPMHHPCTPAAPTSSSTTLTVPPRPRSGLRSSDVDGLDAAPRPRAMPRFWHC